MKMWSVKEILSAVALIVASIIAIWAMLLPPQGEVDQSILITIAQFLVFAATLLGVDSSIERMKKLLKK
jgi:Fe2+ transport system protein B